MKKNIALLLALTLALSLCACNKEEPAAQDAAASAAAPASPAVTPDIPPVEVKLSADAPLPRLHLVVPGQMLPYDENLHLNVFLPDGVDCESQGGGLNNWQALRFIPKDGSWEAKITVGQEAPCAIEWGNMENNPQDTSANKLLIEDAKYDGFNAKLFADEGKNWKYDNGIYLLLVDFGDTHVGRHTHMAIEATGSAGKDKPDDFLAIPELAALLTKLSVEEGAAQNTWSQNGVTCTFPDSFRVSEYGDRGWSGYSVGNNGSTHVNIYTTRSGGQSPEEAAANISEDVSTREWGARKWIQAVRIPDEDSTAPYSVTFCSEFSDSELLRCDLSISKASLEELLAYVESDEFASIMEAVDASPEARQAANESEWDKGASNGADFEVDGRWVCGYNGSETDIIIPEHIQGVTITGIYNYAFQGLDLTSVQIPDTVGVIGSHAFEDCTSLKEVRLSEGLEKIGDSAFSKTAITEITIPRGVIDIYAAFDHCEELETVHWLCSADIPSMIFNGCSKLKTFDAEGIVEAVGQNAFNSCTSLEKIELPSVTAIGQASFLACENLKEATFGELTELGEQSFYRCAFEKIDEGLIGKTVELPKSVFEDCVQVSEIRVPEGVKVIGDSAFGYCGMALSQPVDIYLPAGLETVADYAFKFSKVGNVYFGASIKDVSQLPAWDAEYGPCFMELAGNFVFGKDLYTANQAALEAYCEAIPGVGAARASDTPVDTAVYSLLGAWSGTMDIDAGPRAGSYKVTGDFDYSLGDGNGYPYIDIYQEGVEDAVISYWVDPRLETGSVHPDFEMEEVGWFLDHDIVDGPDRTALSVINRADTVDIEYDYNDGYTCHVSIHLTKD